MATPPTILDHKLAAAERQDAKTKVVVQARRALQQGSGTSVGVWEERTVEQQPSRIPVAGQFVTYQIISMVDGK